MNRTSWAILFFAFAACGCESKMVPASVSGNVTLGGAPLDGAITFTSTSASQKPAAVTPLIAGKYSIPASGGLMLGDYRVEISSLPPAGTTAASPVTADAPPRPPELVPARYNSKSDLTVSLTKTENTADFDLKPK